LPYNVFTCLSSIRIFNFINNISLYDLQTAGLSFAKDKQSAVGVDSDIEFKHSRKDKPVNYPQAQTVLPSIEAINKSKSIKHRLPEEFQRLAKLLSRRHTTLPGPEATQEAGDAQSAYNINSVKQLRY